VTRQTIRSCVSKLSSDVERSNSEHQIIHKLADNFSLARIYHDCANLGTVSLRISSRLPINSEVILLKPVRFPPGRARLSISPTATGSPPLVKTRIVLVAFLAARAAVVALATIRSTLRRTNSSPGRGSDRAHPQRLDTRKRCFFLQYNIAKRTERIFIVVELR